MKKLLFAFFTFFAAFSSISAQTNLEKGDKQFELNNFPAALQTYTKLLKETSSKASVEAKIAETHLRLGDNTEAEKWFGKAAEKNNVEPIVFLKLGKTMMRNAKYAEAQKWFEKASKNYPNEAKHMSDAAAFALENANAPSLYQIANTNSINSAYDEFGAAMTNNKLIYSSGRQDMQRKTSKLAVGANQLFVSEVANGKITSNSFFKSDLKNNTNEGPISYSEDGKTAVITKNNFINGVAALQQNGLELSLSLAETSKDGEWNNAKPFSQNMVGYNTGFACLNTDATVIYFSSDRPGGEGGFDIYMSKKSGDTWATPTNLGDVVNTPGNEIMPFLEGNNLFFSSDYHQGLGGYDVFRTEKTGQEWKTIFHLGSQINSASDDFGFTFDTKQGIGFVTSNRPNGKGGTDIYTVKKQSNEMIVKVLDENKKPLEGVSVNLSACGEAAYLTNAAGIYSFQTVGNFECAAIISKEGFDSVTKKITASNATIEVLLKATEKVVVSNVPMYKGTISNEAKQPLDGVSITAVNQKNQSELSAISNINGEYSLPLEKESNYLINYSRPGFINFSANAKTGDGTNLAILGKKVMNDVASLPIDYVASDNSGYSQITKGDRQGFAVQVASVTGLKADLAAFKKIASVGELYTTSTADNVTKVKVGTFKNREDAVIALNKIKEQGYIQAFLMEEGKKAVQPKDKQDVQEKKEKKSIAQQKVQNTRASKATNYRVRVITLTDASKFDTKALERIATIEKFKSEDKTIIFLTNFDTLDEAKSAKTQTVQLGFKDAQVVEPKDGKFVKVE